MNSRQYNYITTLARELNFSRAAESLNISQPTLSQYVKKLERELGADLFTRRGSEVDLTDAGRVYIDYGKKFLNLQHSLGDALLDIASYKTGKLRVALSPCRCDTIMPEVVKQFRLKYPGIQVAIQEILASGLLRGIDNDDYDIGVTPLPRDTTNYICSEVLTEEILLAVPKTLDVDKKLQSYIWQQRDNISVITPNKNPAAVNTALNEKGLQQADHSECYSKHLYPIIDFRLLNSTPFITMQEWQGTQKRLLTLCEECGVVINPVVECTNNRTMLMMAQHGIGCTLIPSSIIRAGEKERYDNINLYSIKQNTAVRTMVSIYRKEKKLSAPAKYMLELLKNAGNT